MKIANELAEPKWKEHLSWGLALYFLNVVDMMFTIGFLLSGVEEANPVMAWAWASSPVIFVLYKTVFMATFVGLFLHHMRSAWHNVALRAMCSAYGCICVLHVCGFIVLYC